MILSQGVEAEKFACSFIALQRATSCSMLPYWKYCSWGYRTRCFVVVITVSASLVSMWLGGHLQKAESMEYNTCTHLSLVLPAAYESRLLW